ncbi:MAG TPA: YciI family protein [bacterium]|nr:YciI family protein [bacterium]
MSKFMFLFRSNPGAYQSTPPEQIQKLPQLWKGWVEKFEKKGHWIQPGNRLDWGGKVIRNPEGIVTDGPYVEVKDFVQGYMFAEAAGLDEAVELSKDCPIFAVGGTVEIRPCFEG